jgi:hypothetical protein
MTRDAGGYIIAQSASRVKYPLLHQGEISGVLARCLHYRIAYTVRRIQHLGVVFL